MGRPGTYKRIRRLALCAVAALGACGDRQSNAGSSSLMTEGGSAALSIEEMARLPAIAATADLRIDGEAHDLVALDWLGVLSDGTIAILQRADHGLRFFDTAGKAVGSFGGRGGGPGEFQRPIRAGFIGDTIWVGDPVLKRVTLVSPQRSLLRTISEPTGLLPAAASPHDTSSYRAAYTRAMFAGDTSLTAAFHAPTESTVLLKTTSNGTVLATILTLPNAAPSAITVHLSDRALYAYAPYAARSYSDVAPDGRAVALLTTDMEQSTYTLTVVDPVGDTVFVREIAFEGEPIPADSMDAAVEKELERVPPSHRVSAKRELTPLLPDHFPPANSLRLDALGRSWIGLRPDSSGSRWLMFSEVGKPIGFVTLPPRARLFAAAADAVYAVERDEFDVESIVRYRVDLPD